MTYRKTYWILLIFFSIAFLGSCVTNPGKKINKRVTLWRKDKIPYGTYYAYENLSYMFPQASIEIQKLAPDFLTFQANFSEEDEDSVDDDEDNIYLIISPRIQPNTRELGAILNYAQRGQHVFISALALGENLLDTLNLETAYFSGYFNYRDSLTVNVNNPVSNNSLSYNYPGMSLDNYFVRMDSSMTTILGKNGDGKVNFVKFSYDGGGALYLHLAPIAFTNFFLLHKQNKGYYDNVLSYLPSDAQLVQWDDYFRHSRRKDFSALQVILGSKELRWAFWLLLFLFALIYLFESKRRQRIIPLLEPLRNASLDFVKTIGRLYFQRKDNKDLASKMSAHFLDSIRTRFNIPTSELNEEFEHRLAYKSGYDLQAIRDITYTIKTLPHQPSVSDEFLIEFNLKLEKFNKHT